MKVIKKYTAVQINQSQVDSTLKANLIYGQKYHYDDYVQTEFDSEEEAIEYVYNRDKWATYVILPVIRFENFD